MEVRVGIPSCEGCMIVWRVQGERCSGCGAGWGREDKGGAGDVREGRGR